MAVLEREHELAVLAEAARGAAEGQGRVVLISGEAGIGKSRLVHAARSRVPAEGRVLVGHCDDLATPQILGPFRDLANAVGTELATALRGADRDRILTALHTELQWAGHPTLLAIEDIHWADDATLDVLGYLIRRVHQLPVVLLLTYRDEDLTTNHPVRRVLGQAAASGASHQLPLRRLSRDAVKDLATGTELDADEVFAITAGNPFFVGEVIAAGDAEGVPRSVVAAVMARVHTLDPDVRQAVEQLAVLPTAIGRWLVDELVPGGLPTLANAEERGLLTVTPQRVAFRHELGRRAILDGLPAIRRMRYNANVLAALEKRPESDTGQLVHYAARAGDHQAIARYGPAAARDAARTGAHREAVAHYQLVLDQADDFEPAERAQLLEDYAVECYTVGRNVQAADLQERAIAVRRELGDDLAVGTGLWWRSRMLKLAGDQHGAEVVAEESVAVLEKLGEGHELALAYTNLAALHLFAHRYDQARPLAERAIDLARATSDQVTLAHALNALAVCRWDLHLGDGHELMEESLRVALEAGAPDPACRAYANLACGMVDRYRLDEAEQYVRSGREFAQRVEHLGALTAMTVLTSRIHLGRGEWDDAERTLSRISRTEPMHGSIALMVLGRVAARRGATAAEGMLATSVALSRKTGDLQRIAWSAAAAAEGAWLRGAYDEVQDLAREPFDEAFGVRATVLWPELAYWLRRAGHQVELTTSDSPFALLLDGDWRGAAERWRSAGCRYEHALALYESGDPGVLLEGLKILEDLDARPLAQLTRLRLRDLGVSHVPRGRSTTTRENPAGLTTRQLEVLRLLAEGLSDAEIAGRLTVSVRTASNHVAAVLHRLEVRSRRDAAELWTKLSSSSS
ncbi:ATP-binding protein [Tenggerimyces flavus]|uniref:ATP-binding protein n=1 Tax=Tenggerimyces flavus TaxID=1708749 RepID=A0ABV7Y969_9ACTN|nr:LuxR family transcriptional regulator [Tenggerimyces flavus]MBM7785627.1 DNA-binding CsgD family transcriptional regulator [Tenggerimyces flavus]